jgi:hypothetical protein
MLGSGSKIVGPGTQRYLILRFAQDDRGRAQGVGGNALGVGGNALEDGGSAQGHRVYVSQGEMDVADVGAEHGEEASAFRGGATATEIQYT